MINWLINNKEWIFGGIGIAIISVILGVIKFIIKSKNDGSTKIIQKQHNGCNSKGTQIGIQNNYRGDGDV